MICLTFLEFFISSSVVVNIFLMSQYIWLPMFSSIILTFTFGNGQMSDGLKSVSLLNICCKNRFGGYRRMVLEILVKSNTGQHCSNECCWWCTNDGWWRRCNYTQHLLFLYLWLINLERKITGTAKTWTICKIREEVFIFSKNVSRPNSRNTEIWQNIFMPLEKEHRGNCFWNVVNRHCFSTIITHRNVPRKCCGIFKGIISWSVKGLKFVRTAKEKW